MNKQMKKHLEAVVESIVSNDTTAAKEAFQQYLSLKTKALLSETSEECDDMDDKKDDAEDEGDDKKDDKKKDKKKDDKKDEGDE
jgi:hypothetical protein